MCLCRLRSLADGEADVDVKMRLRRLFRSLQGVDDEITRYNAMLAKFLDAKEDEWEAIVAVYRGDLQKAFFEHMQVRLGQAVVMLPPPLLVWWWTDAASTAHGFAVYVEHASRWHWRCYHV